MFFVSGYNILEAVNFVLEVLNGRTPPLGTEFFFIFFIFFVPGYSIKN